MGAQVPETFELFLLEWGPKIHRYIWNAGIPSDAMEDAYQEIVAGLWAGRYLERYDPSRGSLSTYMTAQIIMRVKWFKREWVRHFMPTVTVDLDGDPILDSVPDTTVDAEAEVVATHVASEVETALGAVLDALSVYETDGVSRYTKREFASTFRMLVDEALIDGTVNLSTLAKRVRRRNGQVGVSRQQLSAQVHRMLALPEVQAFRDRLRAIAGEAAS